jgi:hypothetical protein
VHLDYEIVYVPVLIMHLLYLISKEVRKIYFDQYKKHKEELLKENPHFKRRRRRKSEVQKASGKVLNNNNSDQEQ